MQLRTIGIGAFLAATLAVTPAFAQDDMGTTDDTATTEETPAAETDYSADATATTTAAPAASGDSDFATTDGKWGFQISRTLLFGGTATGAGPASALGVRKWTGMEGWEAGAAFGFSTEPDTAWGLGLHFGMLKGISQHRRITLFWEPAAELALADIGDDIAWNVNVLASIGAEIRLGGLGLPNVGLTGKLSAGLGIGDTGPGDVGFTIGTLGGENWGVGGLWNGTVGVVVYE